MQSVFAGSKNMLQRFAGWLAGRMLANQVIPEKNAGLVSFGIAQGLRSVMEILMILVTGFVLGMFWQSAIILVTFIPLRSYAGGYHAKTPVQCAVMTWLLFFCFLMWIKFVPGHVWLQISMILIAGVCIWICSPVQHENKPLEEYEIVKYRKLVRRIYLLEVILAVVLHVVGMTDLSQSIVAAIVMVCGIMIVAVAEKKMPFVANIGRSSQKDPNVIEK